MTSEAREISSRVASADLVIASRRRAYRRSWSFSRLTNARAFSIFMDRELVDRIGGAVFGFRKPFWLRNHFGSVAILAQGANTISSHPAISPQRVLSLCSRAQPMVQKAHRKSNAQGVHILRQCEKVHARMALKRSRHEPKMEAKSIKRWRGGKERRGRGEER